MTVKYNMRTAAEVLVDQLIIHGVRHAFCVPGESYLAVLDAFHDRDIAVTVCRQEGGAAMMAEAAGKATGRPGVCFVTRGPGATNASPGIHIAQQDSTPMIMFVGQVARGMRGREAFQEVDYRAVFGSMTKWTVEIDDPTRVPELVSRAFHVAANGRPGPVVVALPEDVLTERVAIADGLPYLPVDTAPGAGDIEAFAGLLAAAQRPMVLAGGSRWSEAGSAAMMRFSERFAVPVATTFRRAHLFDALHPNYAGDLGIGPNPKLLARVKDADLLVLVGGRLSEMQTQGYTLLDIPAPQMTFVHVHPDVGELGRVYRPHLGIGATPAAFAIAAADLQPPAALRWAGAAKTAHEDYLAWTETPTEVPGTVNLGVIVVWLRNHLRDDAALCNGAGNYSVWAHRFYRHRQFATQFSPTAGSMGYGIPAAIAVKRLHPDRTVVALSGDGDFLMNGQEFATAVQYGAPVIVIVADNGQYGTIRMHQERHYPGRISATQLRNPDFAAYARAFGGFGATVEKTADFAAAFRAAEQSGLPAIIHLKVDPDAITPTTTLTKIRETALAQRAG
jgi:acetolactate synthase-1/2/3 large subunit